MKSHTVQKMTQNMHTNIQGKIYRNKTQILMIEDDIEISQIIKNAVEQTMGCTVRIAADPFEALNLMSDYFYDFIILDWQLPFLNGKETIETADRSFQLEPSLPARWDTGKVPVIILSASEEKKCNLENTTHFKYAGFISKQQPIKHILSSLSQILENKTELMLKSA